MRFFLSPLVLVVLAATALTAQTAPIRYPSAARGTQSDDLSGTFVPDPYRWLENAGAPEVRAWVAAENTLTESVLARSPRRQEIQSLVTRAWSYPKLGAPFAGGDRLFFYENSGTDNQAVLYVQDRPAVPARVLIDPNAFSPDGLIAIVDQAASPDGKYLAYAVSTQGSAWLEVRVRDAKTGQDTGDELQGIRDGRLAWTSDARGFFYVRTDGPRPGASNPLAPDGRQHVVYHRVGRPQSNDQVIYESNEHPSWRLRASLTPDGQYLIIAARAGEELANRVYFIDLDNPSRPNLGAPLVKLFDVGDALYDVVANDGQVFFVRTTKAAPRGRLVAVDINVPDENHWTTILHETFDPLIDVRRIDDRLVAHRLRDAHSVLELYALDGGPRGQVPLPGVGTVTELGGPADGRAFYFAYSSFLQPPVIYRYDLDARAALVFREARADTSLAQYETTQLFYTSDDGTRIPLFITARRGITLDGTHPTLLTGYGAFSVSETPSFSPAVVAWLELGGIYAVANVRGGGEYGRAWHDTATVAHKRISFDDFASAAAFLVSQRYTRPSSLAIFGSGAGGLLVAATMTRHPELFGAVVIDAGILDMTRFSRFTVGPRWTTEFGSPDRAADLGALLAYSPLQALRAGARYPATLLTVGDHDDFVTPIHSYKFAATMQALQAPQPLDGSAMSLLRTDYDAGLAAALSTGKGIARDADRLTFLVEALHILR